MRKILIQLPSLLLLVYLIPNPHQAPLFIQIWSISDIKLTDFILSLGVTAAEIIREMDLWRCGIANIGVTHSECTYLSDVRVLFPL